MAGKDLKEKYELSADSKANLSRVPSKAESKTWRSQQCYGFTPEAKIAGIGNSSALSF